ncbi:MAG TPA: glycogen debranching protein GlgX, partial [Acetobacteraceae bacterium]|nr:glycogen debranching protein GlgX [Acetobacteraceae bacterium]
MRAEPLGVVPQGNGVHAAIPAPGAAAVTLCLFDAADREVARHRLPHRTGEVHHGDVPGVAPGMRYGLRVEGPRDLAQGHRFNPAKLLIDPWARALDRVPRLHGSLFDTGSAPDADDSGPHAPKGIVAAPLPPLPPRPRRTGPEVIYELHVRGFTKLCPDMPEAIRGTFAGLAHPAAIAHLRALGVTLVELLPCAAWIDERHLPPLGLTNYWGYNPVAFCAPDPRLAPGGMAEVRAAVTALQAAGIGVILDVVLNHTGEGDHLGPTLSLKGLGNAHWYRLRPHDPARYVDDAGCGNTPALDRPWPMRLAMDALRVWAEEAGMDGFRLDLAPTLGRRDTGFDPAAPLLLAMRQDPALRERLIIAEPWDIGPDGYQLGRFAPGWGEWNDRFRDTVRRFWRGDAGMVGELATRLAGSADLLGPGRPVTDSVNFVTAHDGLTLADLVSYTARRNAANGEDGRDGTADNHSWNCGEEGPATDPGVLARRLGDMRALLATLLSARGTPMLWMGDEWGRTQGGNNNAYAQDNETSWLDWGRRDEALRSFVAKLVRARLAHPALHAAEALTGAPAEGADLPDVAWLRADGAPMAVADWTDPGARTLVALLHARGDRCLVALNAGGDAMLTLPAPRPRHRWQVLASSAAPENEDFVTGTTPLPARAVLLLAERRVGARPGEAEPELLSRLAAAAGIATEWHAIGGGRTEVPEGTLRALLRAMDLPAESAAQARDSLARLSAPRLLPPAATVHVDGTREVLVGAGAPALLIRLETGEEVPVTAPREPERGVAADGQAVVMHRVALPPLPAGRHRLVAGQATCHLAVTPRACWLPPDLAAGEPRFGIGAQTYALRHARDQGIGDFTAVAEVARSAAQAGAFLLGISPPHALTPTDRERASPYYPSDRRFLDPILIDLAALGAEVPEAAALRAGGLVDYPAVWAAKRRALAALWATFPRDDAGFGAFRRAGGPTLERFCAFTAIAEREGHTDARRWPETLRRGD